MQLYFGSNVIFISTKVTEGQTSHTNNSESTLISNGGIVSLSLPPPLPLPDFHHTHVASPSRSSCCRKRAQSQCAATGDQSDRKKPARVLMYEFGRDSELLALSDGVSSFPSPSSLRCSHSFVWSLRLLVSASTTELDITLTPGPF